MNFHVTASPSFISVTTNPSFLEVEGYANMRILDKVDGSQEVSITSGKINTIGTIEGTMRAVGTQVATTSVSDVRIRPYAEEPIVISPSSGQPAANWVFDISESVTPVYSSALGLLRRKKKKKKK